MAAGSSGQPAARPGPVDPVLVPSRSRRQWPVLPPGRTSNHHAPPAPPAGRFARGPVCGRLARHGHIKGALAASASAGPQKTSFSSRQSESVRGMRRFNQDACGHRDVPTWNPSSFSLTAHEPPFSIFRCTARNTHSVSLTNSKPTSGGSVVLPLPSGVRSTLDYSRLPKGTATYGSDVKRALARVSRSAKWRYPRGQSAETVPCCTIIPSLFTSAVGAGARAGAGAGAGGLSAVAGRDRSGMGSNATRGIAISWMATGAARAPRGRRVATRARRVATRRMACSVGRHHMQHTGRGAPCSEHRTVKPKHRPRTRE
jgi:hypothetical protein